MRCNLLYCAQIRTPFDSSRLIISNGGCDLESLSATDSRERKTALHCWGWAARNEETGVAYPSVGGEKWNHVRVFTFKITFLGLKRHGDASGIRYYTNIFGQRKNPLPPLKSRAVKKTLLFHKTTTWGLFFPHKLWRRERKSVQESCVMLSYILMWRVLGLGDLIPLLSTAISKADASGTSSGRADPCKGLSIHQGITRFISLTCSRTTPHKRITLNSSKLCRSWEDLISVPGLNNNQKEKRNTAD